MRLTKVVDGVRKEFSSEEELEHIELFAATEAERITRDQVDPYTEFDVIIDSMSWLTTRADKDKWKEIIRLLK